MNANKYQKLAMRTNDGKERDRLIGNILGMLHERTSINKTTKELRND